MQSNKTDNVQRSHATQADRDWVIRQLEEAAGVPYPQIQSTVYQILNRDYSPWAIDASYYERTVAKKGNDNAEKSDENIEQSDEKEIDEAENGAEDSNDEEPQLTEDEEYEKYLEISGEKKGNSHLRKLTREQCQAFWTVMHTDLYDDKELRDTAYMVVLCSLRFYLLILAHRHLIQTEADKDELRNSFFTRVVMGPLTTHYDYRSSNIHTYVVNFCRRLILKEVIAKDIKNTPLTANEDDTLQAVNRAIKDLANIGIYAPDADTIAAHMTSLGQPISPLKVRRALDSKNKYTPVTLSDSLSGPEADPDSRLYTEGIVSAIQAYRQDMLTPLERVCYDYTLLERQDAAGKETLEDYVSRILPDNQTPRTQVERIRRTAVKKMDDYVRAYRAGKKQTVQKTVKKDNEAEDIAASMSHLNAAELNDIFG